MDVTGLLSRTPGDTEEAIAHPPEPTPGEPSTKVAGKEASQAFRRPSGWLVRVAGLSIILVAIILGAATIFNLPDSAGGVVDSVETPTISATLTDTAAVKTTISTQTPLPPTLTPTMTPTPMGGGSG